MFQEFEKILLQYDKNGDGELSVEEMAKYYQDVMVCTVNQTFLGPVDLVSAYRG